MPGDEIWDEERWEAFLRENDRRLDRYMTLLFAFMARYPPPSRNDEQAVLRWETALREYLRGRGLEPPASALGGPDDDPGAAGDPGEPGDVDPDDALLDDILDDVARLPIYRQALALATDVLEWSNNLPGAVKDSTLVQLCAHLTQVPAHVANGHDMGYEQDMLGGNIACAKRGLSAANAALELLREARPEVYMDTRTYGALYERTYELRNALGIYVQELRARFDLGID